MSEKAQTFRTLFLKPSAQEQDTRPIFLVNGVETAGDRHLVRQFLVLLRRDGHSQLVYKHAISTIMRSPGPVVRRGQGRGCS